MGSLRKNALYVLGGILSVCVCAGVGDHIFPPNLGRLKDISVVVEGDNGTPLRVFSTPDGLLRLKTSARSIDPRYIAFLKAYEDKRFDTHIGVDPLALTRATWQWVKARQIVSGGSTLTMQVARLLEPRERTILSKCTEILRAMQLEWHYSKDQILDMYATLAPFGGRIEGVRSASYVYFQKEPAHLTIAEAALLTVLPQAPSHLRPDHFPDQAKKARAKVLKRFWEQNLISKAEYVEALAEPIPQQQHSVPLLAPHLSEELRHELKGETEIATTLQPWLQTQIQDLVKSYGVRSEPEKSIAVMVVENKTKQLRVHVGSRDYLDRPSEGFVDMTQAIRSPGSTLKPFIYALSFEDHQTHPQTLIWDQTILRGDYRPTNFGGNEHGQVTVGDALRYSFNIPAVKILDRFGPIRFSETLRQNDIELRLPSHTALPNVAIALGGVGVTLRDLIRLYTALATDRKICPLSYLQSQNANRCQDKKAFISLQTQEWIKGILQNTPRPHGYNAGQGAGMRQIAFKTGTSYGYRDAWAIGYNDDYTVGVWVGKASGVPVSKQTGLGSAAPILFSVFEKLPVSKVKDFTQTHESWLQPAPERLKVFSRKPHTKQTFIADDGLEIISPVRGATFLLKDVTQRGLTLKARNGERPLTWIINGAPLESDPWKRSVSWKPLSAGFYDITVLDKAATARRRHVTIMETPP